jgi:hypothetical protein
MTLPVASFTDSTPRICRIASRVMRLVPARGVLFCQAVQGQRIFAAAQSGNGEPGGIFAGHPCGSTDYNNVFNSRLSKARGAKRDLKFKKLVTLFRRKPTHCFINNSRKNTV